jgi:hypothetical protein
MFKTSETGFGKAEISEFEITGVKLVTGPDVTPDTVYISLPSRSVVVSNCNEKTGSNTTGPDFSQ